MKIDILAVGKQMPAWVNAGVQEYLQRLPAHWHATLHEISPAKRTKNTTPEIGKHTEGQALLANIPASNYVVALEVGGKMFNTPQLAEQLVHWQKLGQNISLLIGGADGFAPECLARSNLQWSLSPLTFPHPLVRIILVEQLYRAYSLLSHHPYHRE